MIYITTDSLWPQPGKYRVRAVTEGELDLVLSAARERVRPYPASHPPALEDGDVVAVIQGTLGGARRLLVEYEEEGVGESHSPLPEEEK